MFVIRYYSFSCTACGRHYAEKLSPVLLGTGKRRCKKCGAVFRDGCKEWPQLEGSQKFQYFFPTMVLGFFGAGVVLPLAVAWLIRDQPEVVLPMGVIAFLTFALPWIPYFLLQWRHIPKSRARYERHRVFGDTDEFVL